MLLNFNPEQCADAVDYLRLGQACARSGACWSAFRPIGASLYFSLPFRLGIAPRFIILLNLCLIALSAALAADVIGKAFEFPSPAARRLGSWTASAAGHLLFLYGDAWTSMTDGPAACLALIGIWLLMSGALRGRGWRVAASGLLLGLAVITRAFYLYSSAAAWAVFLFAARRQNSASKAALAAMGALMAAPILMQATLTHSHTGRWSLIDKDRQQSGIALNLSAPFAGYDTISGAGYTYMANDCLTQPGTFTNTEDLSTIGTLAGAWRARDYAGIACVVLRKERFYFASYASRTYLHSSRERIFSPLIAVLHLLVLASLLRAVLRSRYRGLFLAPLAFIGLVWLSGSVIVPNTRYLAAFYVFVWSLGLGGALSAALGSTP